MMKSILFILLIFTMCLNCSGDGGLFHPTSSDQFSIYLLTDLSIKAGEISEKPLNELVLKDEAIITSEDLNFYKWKDHSFSLQSQTEGELKSIIQMYQSTSGIPFIVAVGDQRIYLGSFWFAYSSSIPVFPHIESIELLTSNKPGIVLKIEKSWLESGDDKRNDLRIYTALKAASILQE